MNNVQLLLSKRWIIKQNDRDLYYKIKDDAKNLKKLFQNTLGYSLISHQNFIKLDKIPGKAEPWMGICDFHTIEEYQLFCYILIFLEDKDAEEQFVLSHLTEFIQVQLKVNEDYWLTFSHRKMFVNVLKYCMKENLLIQNDGQTEKFVQNESTDVLFENTGLSRYFMRNFVSDIYENKTPQDFMKEEWIGLEQDRGIVRKQRIYRRLILSCGIYSEDENNDDFSFIRRYRKSMENDFQKLIPCTLQVYKTSAYLILDDEIKMGRVFPKNNARDELVVLVMSYLRKRIKNSDLKKQDDECLIVDKKYVLSTMSRIIKKNEKYLPVTYREKNRETFIHEIYMTILQLGFACEDHEQVIFYPIIGKLTGSYEEE